MSGAIDPGCIRIRVALEQGRVHTVELASDRPAVASALRGRPADAAVRLVPLLFALCGKAQGHAAELALAAARGVASAPRLDPAIAAEAMREHLWRWLLDLPPLFGAEPLKREFASALAMVGADRGRLASVLTDPRIEGLMRRLDDMPDVDETSARLLPGLDAAATLAPWPRLDGTFSRRPDWQGRAAETGALARRRDGGGRAFSRRWRARLEELMAWVQGTAEVGAAGTASSVQVAPGVGRSVVETARGLLMHEIVLDGNRIADYVIVAPTEWNFHPAGPLVGWLLEREAMDRGAFRAFAAHAVAALDPCVRWELDGL